MKIFGIKADKSVVETTVEEVIRTIKKTDYGDTDWFDKLENKIHTAKPKEIMCELNSYNIAKDCGFAWFESSNDRRLDSLKKAHVERALERVGGNQDVICEFGYYDEENGQVRDSHRTNLKTMLEEICEQTLGYRRGSVGSSEIIRNIKTVKDVFDSYNDCECLGDVCVIFIGTEAEYNKRKQEKRREELEHAAAEVASKHNVKVNTLEFLKAVDEELTQVNYAQEEWNNPEVRAECWMDCRYAGVSSDVYYDDLNFENGRYSSRTDDLYGIMSWVSENCPLLFAQYENQKLEVKDSDDDEDY